MKNWDEIFNWSLESNDFYCVVSSFHLNRVHLVIFKKDDKLMEAIDFSVDDEGLYQINLKIQELEERYGIDKKFIDKKMKEIASAKSRQWDLL